MLAVAGKALGVRVETAGGVPAAWAEQFEETAVLQAQDFGPKAIGFNHVGVAAQLFKRRGLEVLHLHAQQAAVALGEAQASDNCQGNPQQEPVFLGARQYAAAFGQACADAIGQQGRCQYEQRLGALLQTFV